MINKNQYLLLASVIFGVIASLHLLRSIFGWEMTIADFNVPLYFSYIAVIILVYLSWSMYNSSKN